MAISAKWVLITIARFSNEALSFFLFSLLDVIDVLLCFVYKVADFFYESEWKPCYCSSHDQEAISSGDGNKILVSEKGLSLSTKLKLEEVSDTLYTRPSLLSDLSKVTVNELRRLKVKPFLIGSTANAAVRSTFTVNSTIVDMLQEKINGGQSPRWSECNCKLCSCWSSSSKQSLFVRSQGPKGNSSLYYTLKDIQRLKFN